MEQYKLSSQEIRSLFLGFDVDQNGSIDYNEFCAGVRGELDGKRKQLIAKVFDSIDSSGIGVITCSDIGKSFVLAKHPDVINNRKPKDIVLREFLTTFSDVGTDGVITKEDFQSYYQNTSCFQTDEQFYEIITSIWKGFKNDNPTNSGTAGDESGSKSYLNGTLAASYKTHIDSLVPEVHAAPHVSPEKKMPTAVASIAARLKKELAKRGARGISGLGR